MDNVIGEELGYGFTTEGASLHGLYYLNLCDPSLQLASLHAFLYPWYLKFSFMRSVISKNAVRAASSLSTNLISSLFLFMCRTYVRNMPSSTKVSDVIERMIFQVVG